MLPLLKRYDGNICLVVGSRPRYGEDRRFPAGKILGKTVRSLAVFEVQLSNGPRCSAFSRNRIKGLLRRWCENDRVVRTPGSPARELLVADRQRHATRNRDPVQTSFGSEGDPAAVG